MQNRNCTVVSLADLLPQREFRCQSCPGKVYKTRARYQDHLKQVHRISTETEKRLFNCYHCPCHKCRQHNHTQGSNAFRDIIQLRRHYRTNHMTKNFICAFCEREFDLEHELFLHKCCPPNIVDAEDQSSSEHVTHDDASKTDATRRKENRFLNIPLLNLFHNKPNAVDQQPVSQQNKNENMAKSSTGRPMQKCTQCKRKYIHRHRCSEYPCQECGRVFFSTSSLENHMRKNRHCVRAEDAEDQPSSLHATHEDASKTDATSRKEHRSQNTLRLNLFHDKSNAVNQHPLTQQNKTENKPNPSTGRPMQKCTQCKRKYIHRHRCSEYPCQKCSRVFFRKSSLENHMRKNTHCLREEDIVFVDEIIQLLSSIEDGAIRNPPLVRELAQLLPVLQKIQGR